MTNGARSIVDLFIYLVNYKFQVTISRPLLVFLIPSI